MNIALRPVTSAILIEIGGHHVVLSRADATALREALLQAISESVRAEEEMAAAAYRRGFEDRAEQARPAIASESEAAS